MRSLLSWLALVLAAVASFGFLASLMVHVWSLAGMALVPPSGATFLAFFVGIAIVFVPAVLLATSDRARGREVAVSPGRVWNFALFALLLYALLNFYLALRQLGVEFGAGGQAIDIETPAQEAAVLRAASGHWLLFYFFPLAFFVRRWRLDRPA